MKWPEWELSAEWTDKTVCPDCGGVLITTHRVSQPTCEEGNEIYNGICPTCHKQYSIYAPSGTLTINLVALSQQEKIDELEARIKELENMVHGLSQHLARLSSEQMTRQAPPKATPSEPDSEAQDFRKKYGYLF